MPARNDAGPPLPLPLPLPPPRDVGETVRRCRDSGDVSARGPRAMLAGGLMLICEVVEWAELAEVE